MGISGKSRKDVWKHGTILTSAVIDFQSGFTIGDMLRRHESDVFAMCVVHEYQDALVGGEREFAHAMIAGFNNGEIWAKLGLNTEDFHESRRRVKKKRWSI